MNPKKDIHSIFLLLTLLYYCEIAKALNKSLGSISIGANMLICFECSQQTKNCIDTILNEGSYKDLSQLVSVAIENLDLLQKQARKSGTVTIQGDDAPTIQSSFQDSDAVQTPRSNASPRRIPEIFARPADDAAPILHSINPVSADNDSRIVINDWLFGQFNKLLPVKASCRALARLSTPDGFPLAEVKDQIAVPAGDLGSYLAQIDRNMALKRDEAFATAFPDGEEFGAHKAIDRFANQFVAYVAKDGRVSGLAVSLKLVHPIQEGPTTLQLTDAGWEFARLPNPVLDDDEFKPNRRLSEEEQEFLSRHILAFVPEERVAFKTIIRSIRSGHITPKQLDQALVASLPPKVTNRYSSSFFTTQRSGAISRMTDLGLVDRVKMGTSVSYNVTEQGKLRFGSNEAGNVGK